MVNLPSDRGLLSSAGRHFRFGARVSESDLARALSAWGRDPRTQLAVFNQLALRCNTRARGLRMTQIAAQAWPPLATVLLLAETSELMRFFHSPLSRITQQLGADPALAAITDIRTWDVYNPGPGARPDRERIVDHLLPFFRFIAPPREHARRLRQTFGHPSIERLADPDAALRAGIADGLRQIVRFARGFAESVPFVVHDRSAGEVRDEIALQVRSWHQTWSEAEPAADAPPGSVFWTGGEFVLRTGQGLLRRRSRYRFEAQDDRALAERCVAWRPLRAADSVQIAGFFERHRDRPRMLSMGFDALLRGNMSVFATAEPWPETSVPADPVGYVERWRSFVGQLEIGDAILVRDTKSLLSRVIAAADGGPWSHFAVYVGDGCIFEVDTDAVGYRELAIYQGPRYRLGAYRPLLALADWETVALQTRAEEQSGLQYSYWRAALCGLRNALMEDNAPPTPNGVVYQANHRLVAAL